MKSVEIKFPLKNIETRNILFSFITLKFDSMPICKDNEKRGGSQ